MADPARINVGPQFNMVNFSEQLASLYRSRGFAVTVTPFGTNTSIKFDKNTGGINMLLGLGQGVTANCTLDNNVLTVNYTNEDWTGKIIGFAVGWMLCFIPFITAIVGTVKQVQLTKGISTDAAMVASGGGVGMGMNMGYAPQPAPVTYAQPPMQPVASQPAPAANQTETAAGENSWNCQCGATGNTGAFCGRCGSPRP